ncbi:MBL fold metallo-hydrolase [Candidatus Neomarinimicrobiota bacterium]
MKNTCFRWRSGLAILIAVSAAGVQGGESKSAGNLEVVPVDSQLTLVLGGGGNSAMYVNEREVVVVDSKMGKGAKQLRAMVEEKAAGKAVTVINTHYHMDHIKGNGLYPAARIITGAYTREEWKKGAGKSAYPDVTVVDTFELDLGDERVFLINMGRAHTRNDMVVYFQKRDVLLTGDLVFAGRHPVLMKMEGAHTGSWQGALERLLEEISAETVVPGHGPISDMGTIQRMRDYFADIREALADKDQLKTVKAKYRDYKGFAGIISFGHTVKVMRKEEE